MTEPAGKPEWRRALLAARRARSAESRAAGREALAKHLLDTFDISLFSDVITAPNVSADQDQTTDLLDDADRSAEATGEASRRLGAARPTICAYLPLDSEPLPPELPVLLAERGWRVLLPVAVPGEPLDWAELAGDDGTREHPNAPSEQHRLDPPFRRSTIGVLEPTGPLLGARAVLQAAVVLVPALAVDTHGFRLGRGGGFYDRTLALLDEARSGPLTGADARRQEPAEERGGAVIPADTPPGNPRRAATVAVVFDDELVDALPHEGHDARVTQVATPSGGVRPVTAAGAGSG